MKKNIGAVNALYPTAVVLVGSELEGVINYINIAHVGVIDMRTISISMGKSHHSNKAIKLNMTLSINFPSEDMVVEADYIGLVSGSRVDKSKVFESFYGELKGAPMIKNAPVCMECKVINILDMPNHDVFLVQPLNTYCEEKVLLNGKIDLAAVKPLLFDMHQRKYWKLGEGFANCWSVGNSYKK